MRYRTVSAAALAAAAALALPGGAGAAPASTTELTGPPGTSKDKVVVIGLDGVRYDKLRDLMANGGAPNMARLAASGFYSPSYMPVDQLTYTFSGPTWNAILRGVWMDKHEVTSNSDADYQSERYPDFVTRMERTDPELSTWASGTWGPIADDVSGGPYVSDEVDGKFRGNDARTSEEAAKHVAANGPDVGFVHLDEVDGAGHGPGGASPEYLAAITRADGQVGQIIDAIESRPSIQRERWQVLLTTDHGHTDAGGHGGPSPEERTAWVIGAELGQPSRDLPEQREVLPGAARLIDLAPTALHHMGLDELPEWDLDGERIAPSEDPFDTLAGTLEPGAFEQLPAFYTTLGQLTGFGHQPPAGWRVENGAGMDRGVPEWAGWTFTTDPSWVGADDQQGREQFGGGRGVFAVADGDEFNDSAALSASPQVMESTLVSAPYRVAGAGRAEISFESVYRHEDPQFAEVLVSFDGGPAQRLLRYGGSAADDNAGGDVRSTRERLIVTVPTGAQQMEVRWRYSGANNWFWAIDDPRVALNRRP